jgi:carbon-monoxide dehydrogenase iron sulfur subunit
VQKCELCVDTTTGTPACVKGCPNSAIVFEERG